MKLLKDNKKIDGCLLKLSDCNNIDIKRDKFISECEDLQKGIDNYFIFQRFSYYRWPAWVNVSSNTSSENLKQITPPLLINNVLREWNFFSNFYSHNELFIDPSGMISPAYDNWSVEFWVVLGDSIYRTQDNIEEVFIERELEISVLKITWDKKDFNFTQNIFGAGSSTDEAVIEINCTMHAKRKNAAVILVVRPYNHLQLGGLKTVEYHKDSMLLSINGNKSIAAVKRPDFVLSGNGVQGDIDVKSDANSNRSICKNNMATLALGYNLKKGNNLLNFRVLLNRGNELSNGKFNYEKLKEEFASNSRIKIKNGMNITIPDNLLQNWFYASKISVLNFLEKDIFIKENNNKKLDCKSVFFIVLGYNRMGYFDESLKIIDLLLKNFNFNEKGVTFYDLINSCYILNATVDFFIHTRDIDYLQAKYSSLKAIANNLYKKFSDIKSINNFNSNSIGNYFIKTGHYYDLILLSFTFSQFSYIARCMGIFNDEKKFLKKSENLADIFIKHVLKHEPEDNSRDDDFFFYNVFAGYPFKLNNISNDNLKIIINRIFSHFEDLPLYVKSLGWDVFSSIIVANNLIFLKDERAYDVILKLINIGEKKYILPDFVNPVMKRGTWGNGASKVISSLIFSFIRNIFFIDQLDRLDIFPISRMEWFKPGSEIIIEDAPSRFGNLDIRMIATANEIQFHFDRLPKYIPPAIIINLPVKVKIVSEDDFILKKQDGNSFIINGWPSIVRFIRK